MKTSLDCIPCFLNQALRSGRIATEDEIKIKDVLDEVMMMLKDISLENAPPETGGLVDKKVKEKTGKSDIYKEIKTIFTKKALSMYPSLKNEVKQSKDKILTAIRIAIAGNVIDFGVKSDFDLEKEIKMILKKELKINHYAQFREHLDKADEILYLGDNAGESVFDRILIEELKKPVLYIVRDIPVINDVTMNDAIQAGVDKVATIMSSGTTVPGTILKFCSTKFINIYNKSKFIISKGQGNYEGLSEEKRPIFFLLKAKCKVIAQSLGVNEGDVILKDINL